MKSQTGIRHNRRPRLDLKSGYNAQRKQWRVKTEDAFKQAGHAATSQQGPYIKYAQQKWIRWEIIILNIPHAAPLNQEYLIYSWM